MVHFFIATKKVFLVIFQCMRKKGFLFLLLTCFIAVGYANGASRSIQKNSRNNQSATSSNITVSIRSKKQTDNARSATKTINRSATIQSTIPRTSHRQVISNRSGLLSVDKNTRNVVGRAATLFTPTNNDINFGQGYDTCRDAYFTCMDQFCANIDETYRRCICSSRLNEIKQKKSALNQTSDSLTEFHDLNLDVIKKSAAEVKAMTSATTGEQIATSVTDKSESAQQLSAISDVLAKTKSKSLSTSGTLDAGGDIKSIWSTTDLANGANIANLTGETLYNAVNAQCSEMVANQCPTGTLNMVISAYGMYIENDCSALSNNLSKQKNSAHASIRETEREMGTARIENYDAHNSLSINDCINSVRQDLTAQTACGPNFIHCLDVTGLYLNIDTGEPIYTKNFYNLANQISLSGNILNNQTNHMVVNILNSKKIFAQKSLDKCRDLSNDSWDEFMRQAIIEIHQQQQEKIRTVKNECLGVVNQCYDTQTNQLKDFTNIKDKTLLGLNLETVEDLCREKLDTCSNLYGGGPEGLSALVNNMRDIVNQRIVAECQNLLTEFSKNLCAVQSTDTIHSYPYTCRVYTPGEQTYAAKAICNANDTSASDYASTCGTEYATSLYRRFVNYAMQVCIRPSEYENLNNEVPTLVLQDINIVMDKMRINMGQELSKECERFGGIWITNPYNESNDKNVTLHEQFYNETGTNTKWGYCKAQETETPQYLVTLESKYQTTDSSNNTAIETTSYTVVATYGNDMPKITVPKYGDENSSTPHIFCGYFTSTGGNGTQYYDGNGNSTRKWDNTSSMALYAYWDTQRTTPANYIPCSQPASSFYTTTIP